MGLPTTTKCTIDKLPEAHRRKALNALLEGKSLRFVAEMVGVSHQAVKRYKERVVLPGIREAQRIQAFQHVDKPDAVNVTETTTLTKNIIASSPLRERLEHLWNESEDALKRAKTSVRVVRNPATGELVAVGRDVAAVAPILNQAHKNCELLGKVTGELESVASTNIAIQVVLPAELSGPAPSSPFDVPTIDIGSRRR